MPALEQKHTFTSLDSFSLSLKCVEGSSLCCKHAWRGEVVIIQGITMALCVYVVGGCWETSQSHTSLSVFVPLSAITPNTDIFFIFYFFHFLSKPRHSGGELFLDCPDKWGVSYIWMWSRGEEEWKRRREKRRKSRKKKSWQNHKSF